MPRLSVCAYRGCSSNTGTPAEFLSCLSSVQETEAHLKLFSCAGLRTLVFAERALLANNIHWKFTLASQSFLVVVCNLLEIDNRFYGGCDAGQCFLIEATGIASITWKKKRERDGYMYICI